MHSTLAFAGMEAVTGVNIVSGRLQRKDITPILGAWPIAYKASPFTLTSDAYDMIPR